MVAVRRLTAVLAAGAAAVAGFVGTAAPAAADGPGVGAATIVTVGDASGTSPKHRLRTVSAWSRVTSPSTTG